MPRPSNPSRRSATPGGPGVDDLARGARLTAAMLARGRLYNCQLSYDLGVTESSLSRWRSGGPMSVAMAIELTRHLDVSLDWLIAGRTGRYNPDSHPDAMNELIKSFAALSPADRQLVLALNCALIRHQAAGFTPHRFDMLGPVCATVTQTGRR
jgi:hypothetical protein